MNPSPSSREIEQLSSLLDASLPVNEATRLRARLEREPELRQAYEQLREARQALRSLPARRAPRNFILSRSMAGVRAPTPRLFPAFQWGAAFSAALFVLSWGWTALMGNLTFGASAPLAASAPQAAPLAAEALPTEGAMQALAPASAEETPQPEAARLAPAPAATDMLFAAAPEQGNSADSGPSAKAAGSPLSASPAPPAFAPWLGGLTLLLAACAWALRWQAERKFRQRK